MPQSNQDDNKLIKLLQELPDMKDPRPMDEIYRNVTTTQEETEPETGIYSNLDSYGRALNFRYYDPCLFPECVRG